MDMETRTPPLPQRTLADRQPGPEDGAVGGGRGDSGTGRPRRQGTQALLHPAPVPWHLGPGTPPHPPCPAVCASQPLTQASGQRAQTVSGRTASFTASSARHSSSSAPWTEKASVLRAGNKQDQVLGCRGCGGPQQACAALNVSAGQCRDLHEVDGPVLDNL